MEEAPPVSVVIASHSRPDWLGRCLTGVAQLDYPCFEIVLVADARTLEAVRHHPIFAQCRTETVEETNVSLARNRGAALAAGEIVAFLDDDAVPEPLWLAHHAQALAATGAAASAGHVRGRNGISFQSRTQSVDAEAETHDEPTPGTAPQVPLLPEGRALKLVGTNAAYRRDVFLALGGFDTSYRYYLEDADLSLRLASAGYSAASVPLAEVHHGFGPSPRRTAARRPLDLGDIGRSTAIHCRRHPSVPPAEILARMMRRERKRLLRHMVQGTCEPRDIARLLDGLRRGWAIGMDADLPDILPLSARSGPFRAVPANSKSHAIITSRLLLRRRRLRDAEGMVAQGLRASVFSFSLTPVRHHLRYLESGVWLQTGGQFGRSDRTGPRVRWCRFADRVKDEIARVALARGIGDTRQTGDAVGPSPTTSDQKVYGSRPFRAWPDNP